MQNPVTLFMMYFEGEQNDEERQTNSDWQKLQVSSSHALFAQAGFKKPARS